MRIYEMLVYNYGGYYNVTPIRRSYQGDLNNIKEDFHWSSNHASCIIRRWHPPLNATRAKQFFSFIFSLVLNSSITLNFSFEPSLIEASSSPSKPSSNLTKPFIPIDSKGRGHKRKWGLTKLNSLDPIELERKKGEGEKMWAWMNPTLLGQSSLGGNKKEKERK